MKNILLALTVLTLALPAAQAQESKKASATEMQTDQKRAFASQINELEAVITRENKDGAHKVFQELSVKMHDVMKQTNQQLQNAGADQKARLTEIASVQNRLYSETKKLSADMMKNKTELINALREFIETVH